jgi:CheY-like chemotaxis protein
LKNFFARLRSENDGGDNHALMQLAIGAKRISSLSVLGRRNAVNAIASVLAEIDPGDHCLHHFLSAIPPRLIRALPSNERVRPSMSKDSSAVPNVLVVEDEMILRMRAVDIVQDAGFNPVEAVNADQAMSILEGRSDISLLLTDIQMPGSIDGLKLAHAVHDRWPSIKIILVSGQVKLTDAERPADSRFFGKPLGVEQMITE